MGRYRQRVLHNLARRAESLGHTLQGKIAFPHPGGVSWERCGVKNRSCLQAPPCELLADKLNAALRARRRSQSTANFVPLKTFRRFASKQRWIGGR
jgi:hypothetical protein